MWSESFENNYVFVTGMTNGMLTAVLMFLDVTDSLGTKTKNNKEKWQLEKALTALVNSGTIVPMAALHIQVCSMHVCRNTLSELHHIYSFS